MHLPDDCQQLYTHCSASWACVEKDTLHFPTPIPTSLVMNADIGALGAALLAAEGGGPAETAVVNAAAGKVRGGIEPYDLLRAVASLCTPGHDVGPDHARRMVDLLIDGLRYGASEP